MCIEIFAPLNGHVYITLCILVLISRQGRAIPLLMMDTATWVSLMCTASHYCCLAKIDIYIFFFFFNCSNVIFVFIFFKVVFLFFVPLRAND